MSELLMEFGQNPSGTFPASGIRARLFERPMPPMHPRTHFAPNEVL
jgi:hypothetical protein